MFSLSFIYLSIYLSLQCPNLTFFHRMIGKLAFLFLAFLVGAHAQCQYQLVESIPQHFALNQSQLTLSTYEAWMEIINNAQSTLDVASFYWTLSNGNTTLGGWMGENIFTSLIQAGKRGVAIRIAQVSRKMQEETKRKETRKIRKKKRWLYG